MYNFVVAFYIYMLIFAEDGMYVM